MKRTLLGLAGALALGLGVMSSEAAEDGFKVIFDGKSLDGWKSSTENPNSWKLVDGTLVANGERSHMFYVGDEKPFKNFELKVDCKCAPNSNGGIYIRTKYQETGWPKYGHESQVNNSYVKDPKKSGSLYGIVDVTKQHIPDDTWWTETVTVVGQHITIKLNDEVVVDYEEPKDKQPFSNDFERRLGEGGTFALQAHDPHSTVYYKNIRVKRLPD
jgi:hypothetical protein